MKLDIEILERLYEFGGLMAYRVESFDELTWTTQRVALTFSESVALDHVKRLQEAGRPAAYFAEMVKFNGAFEKLE